MNKILRNQSGFTLVELLIVMLIIAILAVAVAPRFMDLSADAQTRTCQGNQAAMDTATEVWKYADPVARASSWPTAPSDLVGGNMLKQAPVCPSRGDYVAPLNATPLWSCDFNTDDHVRATAAAPTATP